MRLSERILSGTGSKGFIGLFIQDKTSERDSKVGLLEQTDLAELLTIHSTIRNFFGDTVSGIHTGAGLPQVVPCINTATSCCRDAGALHDGSYFSEFWRPKTNTSQPRVGIERKNAEKGRGQMQLQYAKYVNTSFRAQAFEGAFSYSSNIF